jgi:tetratricopeptide (TPR) repeat protein
MSLRARMDSDHTTPSSQTTASVDEPVTENATTSELEQQQEPWKPTEAQQALIDAAEAIKAEGNALFLNSSYQDAITKYNDASQTAPEQAPQQAVYFANIAACHVKLDNHQDAIKACTEALAVDPGYVKALARRSAAYEAINELERALADAKQVRYGTG